MENYVCYYKDLESDEGWNFLNRVEVMSINMDYFNEYKSLQNKIDKKLSEDIKWSPKPETIDKLLKLKEQFIKNDGLTNLQRVQIRRRKEYQKDYQKEYGKEHFQQIKSDRKHCDCCNKDVLIYTWSKHIITDLHRNNMNK